MSLSNSNMLNNVKANFGTAGTSSAVLGGVRQQKKKSLVSGLTLTSLVDCFTILVTYLLVATSFRVEEIKTPNDMKLPEAIHSSELKGGPIARVEGKQYFFGDEKVSLDQLSDRFKSSAQANESIIIQADKKNDYAVVNPMILSALQAGFKKVKFAVLQKD